MRNFIATDDLNVLRAMMNAIVTVWNLVSRGFVSISSSDLDSPSSGVPLIVIILAVLAFLFLICILSTGKCCLQSLVFCIDFVV